MKRLSFARRGLWPFITLATLALSAAGCELIASVDRSLITEEGAATSRGVLRPASCAQGDSDPCAAAYARGTVGGWAELIGQDTPAEVRIEVNGAEVAIATADQPRPDLPSDVAFSVEVGNLNAGDEVSAFIVSTDLELENSPITVVTGPPGTGGMDGAGGS